jgi:Zn-dependent protease
MNGAIRLGRLAGVVVVADASAFLLALLFGGAVFVRLSNLSPEASLESIGILAVLGGLGVVGCVFVHEASHVLVALKRGLSVRSIRLYMFGGYSVIDGAPTPRTEFLVAGVGPLASLLLGLAFLAGPYFLGADSLIGSTSWALGLASVAIGVFNLLPGFPLDGGRIVRSVLARGGRDRVRATRTVTTIGRALGAVSMVAGVYLLATRHTTGLFWLVGGWFLATSAASAGKREELSAAFDGLLVEDVMRVTPDAIGANETIATVLDLYAIGPRLRALPVEMFGKVVGVIGQDEIDSVAPSRWPSTKAQSVMARIGPADVVEAEAPLALLWALSTVRRLAQC